MSRRFMCSEGLLLTYITICDFTCSFIFRNEVVFGIIYYVLNPFKLWVRILSLTLSGILFTVCMTLCRIFNCANA